MNTFRLRLLLPSLAATLLAVGCQSTGQQTAPVIAGPVAPVVVAPPSPQDRIDTLVAQIQSLASGAKTGCRFVPAADFLQNMLGKEEGVFGTALDYVQAICNVVGNRRYAAARRGTTVTLGATINGVPVRGTFIR
jgi:hypothetical protein